MINDNREQIFNLKEGFFGEGGWGGGVVGCG